MPKVTTAQERIDLRTTIEIKELISRAASTAGMSVSAFLISSAQERARQILNESELMTLSVRDWDAFFKALDHADRPRPQLKEAFQKHQSWLEGNQPE